MTKSKIFRKPMTIFVFPEGLNRNVKFWRNDSILYFQYIFKGFLLTFPKMTWMVMIKLQLLRFKATYGLKICTEDVKRVKIKSKFEGPVACSIKGRCYRQKYTKVMESPPPPPLPPTRIRLSQRRIMVKIM